MITITHSQTNRIAGFGILLPPRSMAPRILCIVPPRALRPEGVGQPVAHASSSLDLALYASANRPRNSVSTSTAFSNSSSSTRSFGAWMFA